MPEEWEEGSLDQLQRAAHFWATFGREFAQAILAKMPTSPDGPWEIDDGSELDELAQNLLHLPEEDRQAALDAARSTIRLFAAVHTANDLQRVRRTWIESFQSWQFTLDEWKTNPDVERLTAPLPGTGPELHPPGASDEFPTGWTVRAVDERAAGKWASGMRKLPGAAIRHYTLLSAGQVIPDRQQHPLEGRLGRVQVGERRLVHWEARQHITIVPATKLTPRGKKPHVKAGLKGEMRVLFAPDEHNAVVWITDVRLFRQIYRGRVRSRRTTRRGMSEPPSGFEEWRIQPITLRQR